MLANIDAAASTQRALHNIGMMEVNDSDAFLDLKVLIKHGKVFTCYYNSLYGNFLLYRLDKFLFLRIQSVKW